MKLLPWVAIPVLGMTATLFAAACGSGDGELSPTPTVAATQAVLTEAPLPTAVDATPTPEHVYEGNLRTGVWARVEGVGDCLNFRMSDSTSESLPINYCRTDGSEVYISDGPRFSEDRWWWYAAGLGWAVDEYLTFDREGDLASTVVPELAGQGKIAYMVEGSLWLMNADGTDRERIVGFEQHDNLRGSGGRAWPLWSPDGDRILLALTTQNADGAWEQSLQIVDLTGRTLYDIPNAAFGVWSPDGTRLSFVQDVTAYGLGVVEGTPAIINLGTSERTVIGPPGTHVRGPMWLPNGRELVYASDDGDVAVQLDGSGARPAAPHEGSGPAWSPDGTHAIVFHGAPECNGYAIFRVGAVLAEGCASNPPFTPLRLGRDGSAEDGATDWSPDGRLFAFHTEWGAINLSGVYVVDVATGEQTHLPGWPPAYTSFSPDSSTVVFATRWYPSFIWVGDVASGEVTLLAEGDRPAWQPRP